VSDSSKPRYSPRELFAAHPEVFGEALPIRGGWGYSIDDAVVIDRDDSTVVSGLRFDGVGVEYAFVDKRNHAELVLSKPAGEMLIEIEKKLLSQKLMSLEGRYYDVLSFEITTLPEQSWNMLEAAKLPADEYTRLREEHTLRLVREFWFDITSFYGRYR
jgi:hypothetical protein